MEKEKIKVVMKETKRKEVKWQRRSEGEKEWAAKGREREGDEKRRMRQMEVKRETADERVK